MIDSLLLKNFQSHKKTKLELHPNVNVIIGSSDSGKSAVLRGFNWLFKNRPAGDSFRSRWGGNTEVAIEIGNQIIAREKTDKENKYEIVMDVEEAQAGINDSVLELSAMGQNVPEEVMALLKFDDELNIQYQHDAPFGLSFTSGEMAKLLNRIANIDKIDTALSEIEKRKRKNNSLLSTYQERIDDKKQQLAALPDLPMMEKDIKNIEKIYKEWEADCNEKENLQTLRNEIVLLEGALSLYDNLEHISTQYSKIKHDFDDWQERTIKHEKLYFLLEEITKVKTIHDSFVSVDLNFLSERIIKIQKEETILLAEKEKSEDIFQLIDAIILEEEKIRAMAIALKKMQVEFDEEMGDVCVLCGNPIKGGHTHE